MLSITFLILAILTVAQAENLSRGWICSSDRCVSGSTSTQGKERLAGQSLVADLSPVGAKLSNQSIALLPGTYSSWSTSSQTTLSSIISSAFTILGASLLSGLQSHPHSTSSYSVDNVTSAWQVVVDAPVLPIAWDAAQYTGSQAALSTKVTLSSPNQLLSSWQSVYVPTGVWLKSADGAVIRGSIPSRGQLPGAAQQFGVSGVAFGSGFTGSKCDQCQPGYFGRDCKACSSLCGPGKCDDGRQGSGGCRGSAGNSTLSCNCLYGTCTSSTTCACAAGWVSTLTELCGKCGDGFYLDGDRNCRACALGAKTCTSLTAATSCEAGLQLSSGICTATRCSDGQYWDGNQCSTCSPACTTCFGPNPTDCLRCASPRFNLNGTCVGYDANGACDTSSSSLAGIYIADNTQGRCDACPSGALDCGIPNFSVASTRNQLVSTSCHEGYVLQSGSCILACSNGTFLPSEATPSINGTCQSCDLTVCATCVGSATWCSSCQNGLYADLSGKCVLTCPSGTFADNGRCVSCPPEMITCSSANNALSCASGWPILRNGRCEAVCPSRQYYDAATSSCRSCTSSATSCIGPGANQATSCDDGLRLKGGECLPASCSGGTIPGLNICLEDLVADGAVKAASTWWPFLLVAFGMAGIIGGVAFWLIRTRRKTRAQTKAFGDAMDDRDVERRLNDLSRQETGGKSLEEVLETEFEEEEEACPTRRRRDLFAMLSLQARRLNSIEPRSTRVVHRFGKQKADEYARRSGVAGPQPPPAYSPSTSTSYPESDKKITFETPEELSPPESPAMQLYAPIFHESTSAPQIASPASVAAAPPRMPRSIIKSGRDEVELDDLSGFQTLRPSAIPDAGRRISFADAKPDRTSKDSIDLLGVRNGA